MSVVVLGDAAIDLLGERHGARRRPRHRREEMISVERTHTIKELRETYDPLLETEELEADTRTGQQVAITGRVIFLRNTGKG